MATGNIKNLLPTCRNVSKYTAGSLSKATAKSYYIYYMAAAIDDPALHWCLGNIINITLHHPHSHILLASLSMNYFTRSLSHPILLLDDRLWNSPVFPGGFCRPVHWQRRHVRRGPTGPDIQGRRLLCHHDGVPGERLLHHRRHLDPLLSLQHLHGFP